MAVTAVIVQVTGCGLYFRTQSSEQGAQDDASLPAPADAAPEIPPFNVYIKASNTHADAWFGKTVAMSADGSTLAVSAQLGSAVYVFARDGSTWTQQGMLRSGFGMTSFGHDVSISADGSTIVVGQPWDPNYGFAWVYQRSGASWILAQRLGAAVPEPVAFFGSSVAISGDGQTIAVGAPDEDSTNEPGSEQTFAGAVHVFDRSANGWNETADFAASNTQPLDYFGYDVALSHDGGALVVGAMMGGSDHSGAAYVFKRGTSGWQQQQQLIASNASHMAYFGVSVSISGDGATVAVGAPREDGEGALLPESGAAYIFIRGGATWSEAAYIKAANAGGYDGTGAGSGTGDSGPNTGDQLGWSVALSPSGKRLAVGAPQEASAAVNINGDGSDNSMPAAGAAYIFDRFPTWHQTAYIKASNTNASDTFGQSVSISEAGALAIGAPYEDSAATGIGGDQLDNSASKAGAAYALTIATN